MGKMMTMRNRWMYGLVALAGMGVGVAAARADVLTLKDGTRVEGEVKREGEDWVVTGADGKKTNVKARDVKGLEMSRGGAGGGGGSGGTASNLTENLASLRRSADAATDAKRMAERYRQFVAMNTGTVIEADARADLAVWDARASEGMVKIGSQWLPPAEAMAVRMGASAAAKVAIVALREGRMVDAEKALNEAFAKDPQNPTALYVRGVIYYRQDRFADARKAFEGALVTAPGHGATLGNLAVTLSRLKLWMPAANQLDAALISLPLERGMLNNAAEFLEMLPANQKGLPVVKRIGTKFAEQDNIVSQRLSQQGLYRWGATWIDAKQMDEIKKAEAAYKQQLDLLAGKYEQLISRANELDNRLKQLDGDIAALEGSNYRIGPNGEVIQLPMPDSYAVLVAERVKLRTERQQIGLDQELTKTRARDLQKNPPNTIPKYTGLMQLYAAEAAPIPVESGAAGTQP